MLITLKEILALAEQKGCAVGAFNAPNLESLRAVLAAAEALGLPVVLQHAQSHEWLIPMELIAPILVDMAKKAAVPVCVHLDHGETLAYIERALALGFSSVMYDGSVLPYAENLANTQKVVALAAAAGASVEAELGTMGKAESGSGQAEGDDTKIYTDPALAADFAARTGIDALACSFGTTHGLYLKEPVLDLEIVRQVRRRTDGLPVVMHGGSGVSRADFQAAIRAGVRKINYFTYMDKAGGNGALAAFAERPASSPVFFTQLVCAARDAMRENVEEAMRTFALLEG
jgi:fructose-bisphosphate aldolase class II